MSAISRLSAGLILAWLSCGLTGCAATMAARQPGVKDLTVLQTGTPRGRVIAELGEPLAAYPSDQGGIDVFAFKQGYTRVNRAARALGHATGTIVAGGLWEIAGIPIEAWFDGTDVKLEVHYGPDGRVAHVTVFEGVEALRGSYVGPHVQLASTGTLRAHPPHASPPPHIVNEAPPVGPHLVGLPDPPLEPQGSGP